MLRTALALALISGLAFSAQGAKPKGKVVLKGNVYALGSNKDVLYRFAKKEYEGGKVLRSFNSPDGKKAVTEILQYDANGRVAEMKFKQYQTGESGSFAVKDGKVVFNYTNGGKTETKEEKIKGDFRCSDELVGFIKQNWATLSKGDEVEFRLPVIQRLETVGFEFKKHSTKKIKGQEAVIVRMKPSSMIIAAIVDPIDFTFMASDQALVSVRGRTQPKTKVNGEWTDLDAYTRYKAL